MALRRLSIDKNVLTLVVMAALAALGYLAIGVLLMGGATAPAAMPPTVQRPIEELLAELEAELRQHDPATAQALRPGIDDAALARAEAQLGQQLHPDLRALYRWHNGYGGGDLFEMYEFSSLQDAVQTNQRLWAAYQQAGHTDLMAHEQHWLQLFSDPAGDGYYYDPTAPYEQGGVFYNFREATYYMLFPSLKNLIAGLVECYQQGVYTNPVSPDYELEQRIMRGYGREAELP